MLDLTAMSNDELVSLYEGMVNGIPDFDLLNEVEVELEKRGLIEVEWSKYVIAEDEE